VNSQVTPIAGGETKQSLPQPGLGPAALETPSLPVLPGKLETPNDDLDTTALAKFIRKQRGKSALETVRQLGGSDGTEKAIAYTLAAQSPSRGGWRYHPGNDSDTSITGWQYMALHSARMAGLPVPDAPSKKCAAGSTGLAAENTAASTDTRDPAKVRPPWSQPACSAANSISSRPATRK
jgi:hypothetical protein